MSYEPGEIVEVPFPFVERPIQKVRPALVLSSPAFTQDSGVVVLAMITSARRSSWTSDVNIADWGEAGLRAPSVIRWKVFSIDVDLILNRRGALSPADQKQTSAGFCRCFAAYTAG
ncbi:MAG: type II toxin-antitoxin system PemK/MazF family toxin [Spirochaetaceae bacterium]|nr:MAG: type II toxin-antitoxin system PemK/MazF family toxin [Spirochaetaceae bacterium]